MRAKQKKTLLGAIVTLIMVGTIVLVALLMSGYFDPCKKTPSAMNADAVKEVLKVVKDALANEEYKGGVYVKKQLQYLGEGGKVIDTKYNDLPVDGVTDGTGEVKKTCLQKVTVYGVKIEVPKVSGFRTKFLADMFEKDKDEKRVVGKAVEFKDVTIVGVSNTDRNFPVWKQLKDQYKMDGEYFGFDPNKEEKDRVFIQEIEKKSI